VINGVISSPNFISTFDAGSTLSGTVVALFTAGAFFGAGFAGPVGDRLGRRWTIMMGALIFILGGGLQTGARNLAFLESGRFFAGLGVGFLTMIVPLYQAEIAHPSIRGRVTGLQQFMLGIGALVAGWVVYGTVKDMSDDDSGQWRIPLGLQIIPAVCLAALILLFPESPRWLIDNNQGELGLATLARLHAHGDTSDAWVQAEYSQIQESVTYEHEHEAKSYKDLFTNKSAFRRLLIASSLQAACQMTGVSAIQYFCTPIFAEIGIGTDDSLKYQAINNILALIAQACCMATIDKFGRRWPLIIANLFNCLFFIIATILIGAYKPCSRKPRIIC
jgi:sugar porter (SP) family MFS transporter